MFRDLKWPAFAEETVTIRVDLLCSFTQTERGLSCIYPDQTDGAWETVKNMIVLF